MSTNDKDPKDPSTTSMSYDYMLPIWARINTVLAGTDAMREAGEVLLPKHVEEGRESYDHRLQLNFLLNLTELTLESWVGRPFRSPLRMESDIPVKLSQMLSDVDLQGNNFSVFSRGWFRDALAKGFSHVWVDAPRQVKLPGEVRTIADDEADGIRPYLVLLNPEDVIFAHAEIIDGREVLTHVRFRRDVVEMDGFSEKIKRQIHVAELVSVPESATSVGAPPSSPDEPFVQKVSMRVFEERKAKNGRLKWLEVESWLMGIDQIPLITFYAQKDGFMCSKPPLKEIADLNIRHWQSNSDQIAILAVSRFPMLAASGVSDTNDLVVGPNNWLGMEAANGRFYYVEHKGRAIDAGRQDLVDLEERMANYGAEYLKRRPGNQTATARALDSAEMTSQLQDVATRFNDALATVLWLMEKWRLILAGEDYSNLETAGTAAVSTDFGPDDAKNLKADLLKFARSKHDISRAKFIGLLKEMELLPNSFDEDENENELADEDRSGIVGTITDVFATPGEGGEGSSNDAVHSEDTKSGGDRTESPSSGSEEAQKA